MDKKTGIIIGVIIAAFAGLIGISLWQKSQPTPEQTIYSEYKLSTIEDLTKKSDFSSYDLATIIPASPASGNLPENIKGSADAPVIIFEYADYQCEHCAALNPQLNAILEEYKGKVALVFRNYIMSYHDNGVMSSAAANAAAIQGYWPEYKDLLFSNQNDWFYSNHSKLQGQLEDYFVSATNGKGDLEQFRTDMASEAVALKTAFDFGISERANLKWTPSVFVGDTFVSQRREDETSYSQSEFLQHIRDEIDRQLAAKQAKK